MCDFVMKISWREIRFLGELDNSWLKMVNFECFCGLTTSDVSGQIPFLKFRIILNPSPN